MYIINDGHFFGTLHANWVSSETNWMEVGICIYNPEYWSGGYGNSVFQQWVDYIFKNSDLHRIGISTWSGNIRMMKLAEKVGMIEEARIRDASIVEGQYYDAIKMGILRSEWEENKR
ncbi:GNAT family N-acetyltransferase [Macrococcus sp. EM39E]|uniref:GNAT family N-acetyltransferase n=1 Tax=Macrococcus animalis TaxID=3395467 RepID=UPI0039BE3145